MFQLRVFARMARLRLATSGTEAVRSLRQVRPRAGRLDLAALMRKSSSRNCEMNELWVTSLTTARITNTVLSVYCTLYTRLHQIHLKKSVEENEAGAGGPSAAVLKNPRTYGMSQEIILTDSSRCPCWLWLYLLVGRVNRRLGQAAGGELLNMTELRPAVRSHVDAAQGA